jgi:hypothetical protein
MVISNESSDEMIRRGIAENLAEAKALVDSQKSEDMLWSDAILILDAIRSTASGFMTSILLLHKPDDVLMDEERDAMIQLASAWNDAMEALIP